LTNKLCMKAGDNTLMALLMTVALGGAVGA